MDKVRTTPKDFFYWAGAIIALYWSVTAFIFLLFDYINYALPNALSAYQSDPYQSSIPYDMASITVLLPLFLLLMWLIRRDIARDPSRRDVWVRRWMIILTLFIAGLAAAIDLVVLLTAFFRGEDVTAAFFLKVLIVLLVAAVVFMHFIADTWGYWDQFPGRARSVGWGISVLAAISICSGFLIVGTPRQARLAQFDEQKVQDLQTIQYQVVDYWQHTQSLPTQLGDLNDALSGVSIPADPQTGQPYDYHATGPASFELCANFNRDSSYEASAMSAPEPAELGGSGMSDDWEHGAGNSCFTRIINPQFYPPIKTP